MNVRYAFGPHMRLNRVQADTVGLDLSRNRYFGLGPRETLTLQHHGLISNDEGQSQTLPLDEAQIAEITASLVRAGILIDDSTSHGTHQLAPIRIATPRASAGYEYNDAQPIRAHHGISLIRAWHWARTVLHTETMLTISRHVEQARQRTTTPFNRAHAIALVGTFRTLRPFVYCARDQCLLHALTLTHFLARYQQHPHWVVGVRTKPWAAHSWVQIDDLVMDARPDDVCDYTPLLVS